MQSTEIGRSVAYALWDTLKATRRGGQVWLKLMMDETRPGEPGIQLYPYNLDMAQRNIIVETIHRLNRQGIIPSHQVDTEIAEAIQYLHELYYPSTKAE